MVELDMCRLEPAPESCRRPSDATTPSTHTIVTSCSVTSEHLSLALHTILAEASRRILPPPPLMVREKGRKGREPRGISQDVVFAFGQSTSDDTRMTSLS
jgi:hypothetical protein